MVYIKEIFTSVQGEGPYIGYKQLFIRFCGCNLNCKYCDTDFDITNSKKYTKEELLEICNQNLDCHSVSLTGGEPLLHVDFLQGFLKECPLPVYLETNGILYENLQKIINDIDFISADIKLPSCSGIKPHWAEHYEFFKISNEKNLYAKAVFDSNIRDDEIQKMCTLCKEFDIELVIQPMMKNNKLSVTSDFIMETLNKCANIYSKVRLIPQVHKFIGLI